jgi:hypothetical protein
MQEREGVEPPRSLQLVLHPSMMKMRISRNSPFKDRVVEEKSKIHLLTNKEWVQRATQISKTNNLRAMTIRLADFAVVLTKGSMRNLSIFIIGKSVPCLHNAGNVVKLLRLQILTNTYLKNANKGLNISFVQNARVCIE